jgi:hypothetical protein
MRTIAMVGLTAALLAPPTEGVAQEYSMTHEIEFSSCPRADSVLGPIRRIRGTVRGEHDSLRNYTSFHSGESGRRISTLGFNVSVGYTGPGPIREPSGYLHAVIFGDRQLEREAFGEADLAVKVIADDTTEINLGTTHSSRVTGNAPMAVVPVSVRLSPSDLLALARARKGRLMIGTRRFELSRPKLEDVNAVYRAALCVSPESLPPAPPAQVVPNPGP